MAAPWEKYQPPTEQKKPWEQYAAPVTEATPAEPGFADQLAAAARDPLGELAAGGKQLLQHGINLQSGLVRGAGSIGATLLRPFESAEANAMRRREITAGLESMGAQPNSLAFQAGKLGGEIAGTAGVGGALAIPFRAAAPVVSSALASGGTAANLPLWARGFGGAVTGGVSSGLLEPTVESAGLGATLGGALPVVGQGWSAARDWLSPQLQAKQAGLGTLGNDEATINALIAANRAAPGQRAREIAGNVSDDLRGYQTLLARAEAEMPIKSADAARAAERASNEAALAALAGGESQTTARGAQEAAKKGVGAAAAPLRESSLTGANVPKPVYPAPGSLDFDAVHPIAREGVNISPIVSDIRTIKAPPGINASEIVQKVLSHFESKIKSLSSNNGGYIHPDALYTVRKEMGNDIKRFVDETKNWDQKLTGKLQSSLQDSIDAAIKKAGGAEWDNYLKAYEKGMQGVNRKELAATALKLYQDSPDDFIKLVRGDKPDLVENIFGPRNYDIKKVMGDDFATLERVAKDAKLQANIAEQATKGQAVASQAIADVQRSFRIPNALSVKATMANAAFKELEGKVNRKALIAIREAAGSGADMNALLEALPPSERSAAINVFKKYSGKLAAPLSANAMAGE